MSKELRIWGEDSQNIIPASAKTPKEITSYAVQLKKKEKNQIVSAFDLEHYDMGLTFLWDRTASALKNELATVGVSLLGEMLGRPDVDENDDVNDILTTKDAIHLAEELGVISSTDAMRLRQTNEMLNHFSQMSDDESENEEIEEHEAKSSLKACVKSVLSRPKIEVAKNFVDFRESIESSTLQVGDSQLEMLISSPYFFKKLTLSILLNAAKNNSGAQLEHSLANINTLVPLMWDEFRGTERWQVGHAYAEAYSDGKTSSVSALKSALMKVGGFDYVPENLRSDTFVKAAEAVLRAHDGAYNFYNEHSPVMSLAKLGSAIPTPAFPACMTALLSIKLGNKYGHTWDAQPVVTGLLDNVTSDRWQYYLNQVLPGDMRVLGKLLEGQPLSRWIDEVKLRKLDDLQIKNSTVARLVNASVQGNATRIASASRKLISQYYGENK